METAYLAAATSLLWMALYYLPVGSPLFRLALPLPLALLQLRHGWRCALRGRGGDGPAAGGADGPDPGPPGAVSLWPAGPLAGLGLASSLQLVAHPGRWVRLIGTAGFLVRVAVLSVLVGENLWVLITTAAAGLLERFAAWWAGRRLRAAAGAAGRAPLLLLQNLIVVLATSCRRLLDLSAAAMPISEPPPALRALVALDPL